MSEAIYKVIDEKYAEILHTLSEKEKVCKSNNSRRVIGKHANYQMIMGLPNNPLDEQLTKDRIFVRQLYRKYNLTPPGSQSMDPMDEGDFEGTDLMGEQRRELIAQILRLNDIQKNKVELEPPFFCCVFELEWFWVKDENALTFNICSDYDYNIKIEGSFYANFNATILIVPRLL